MYLRGELLYDCDMNPIRRKHAFIERIRADSQFHLLFDPLKDVCMFAKDVEGRLLVVNQALLRRFGLRDEREIIGKTDHDFLPRGLAEQYRADDRRVMATGKPLLNLVELFLDARGIPTWHLTNKMPIRAGNRVAGVMGTIESYEAGKRIGVAHGDLLRAVEHIRERCAGPVSIRDLAARCGVSVRQFERRFREQLRMTPRELIMRMRVHRACDVLRETREAIADVALRCGFYDQAAFTRQFKKHVGLTPATYRRRYG